MQVKIFAIPLFGGDAAMEEMNAFLRGNKVVDITKTMVQQGDVSFWSFCVTYLLPAPPKTQPNNEKKDKIDYKQVLDAVSFERFSAMRVIRKKLADADAVPAYAVFTDAELAEFTKMQTVTPAEMLKVSGIGEKRVEKYGNAFCGMLYASPEQDNTLKK